jgi:hypothetical protein
MRAAGEFQGRRPSIDDAMNGTREAQSVNLRDEMPRL